MCHSMLHHLTVPPVRATSKAASMNNGAASRRCYCMSIRSNPSNSAPFGSSLFKMKWERHERLTSCEWPFQLLIQYVGASASSADLNKVSSMFLSLAPPSGRAVPSQWYCIVWKMCLIYLCNITL